MRAPVSLIKVGGRRRTRDDGAAVCTLWSANASRARLKPLKFQAGPLPARAPDSEVVGDRLKLLAGAIGVKRSEIVVIE